MHSLISPALWKYQGSEATSGVCVLISTERKNHACELMKDYNFSGIDGIIIASGDGLVYEVLCSAFTNYVCTENCEKIKLQLIAVFGLFPMLLLYCVYD